MRNIVLPYALLAVMSAFSLPALAATAGTATVVSSVIAGSPQTAERVDLNTADATTLQSALEGVGKIKAEAIVAYREANGPFGSVDELLEVKGIGSSLLERNKGRLIIK